MLASHSSKVLALIPGHVFGQVMAAVAVDVLQRSTGEGKAYRIFYGQINLDKQTELLVRDVRHRIHSFLKENPDLYATQELFKDTIQIPMI